MNTDDYVSCDECYAVVPLEREYAHGLWHSDIWNWLEKR